MFDGMFDNIDNEDTRNGLNEIKAHLKNLTEKKDEGTKLLSEKLDTGLTETLMDSVMLCPGTAPFEWDPIISEKLNLGGEPALLHVCVPKSIVLAFALKNKIYTQVDKESINEHESIRKMLQLIFMKGVASFIHDEEGLRDKIMAKQFMEMMEHMRRKDDDD